MRWILVLFLLLACTPQQAPVQNVHFGTEGVVFGFRENAPPEEVKQGQPFRMVLDLHNKGAYDIQRGYYALFGFSPEEVQLPQRSGSFALRGRSLSDPVGERISERFDAQAGAREVIPVHMSVCYPYKTTASATVCVDTDPENERNLVKSCSLSTHSLSGGQGGPMGIRAIETNPVLEDPEFPERVIPEFEIEIENFGKGDIVDPSQLQRICGGELVGKNKVQTRAFLSNQPLECDEEFDLEEQRGTLLCRLIEGIDITAGAYPAPLVVELEYGYVETDAVEIRVRRTALS